MSAPFSPRLLKGGLVFIDPASGRVTRAIALQYNPESLSRSLQIQGAGGEGGGRSEPLRLKGPAVETIKLDAEIDATDQMEFPAQNAAVGEVGIFPQLALLETLVYPTSAQLQNNNTLQSNGTLEIIPMEAPLTLFIWSSVRVLPVRVTELSITEEAFDTSLNPIRAKVSLSLRVLSVDDLGFDHRGGTLFMAYLRNKEGLAGRATAVQLSTLGVEGL